MVRMRRGTRGALHSPPTTTFRELDQRKCAGLTVTLEWEPVSNQLQIRCEDERAPEWSSFSYPVAPGDARRAFLHPFILQLRTPGNSTEASIPGQPAGAPGRRRRRWQRERPEYERGNVADTNVNAAADDEMLWLWWEI
jgi:hypothetical protein